MIGYNIVNKVGEADEYCCEYCGWKTFTPWKPHMCSCNICGNPTDTPTLPPVCLKCGRRTWGKLDPIGREW